jgi:hypothetical protein
LGDEGEERKDNSDSNKERKDTEGDAHGRGFLLERTRNGDVVGSIFRD